ncbi:MAG: hypothetical protein HXS44_06610 [Theionarchaea archaeon]|nr:hypothetical protein [Theionarchaea archaeon]
MEKSVAALMIMVVIVSGANSAALLLTMGDQTEGHFTITLDLKGLTDSGMVTAEVFQPLYENPGLDIMQPVQNYDYDYQPGLWTVSSLFDTSTYFVVGDAAYTTDVLGATKLSYALASGGSLENPEGRTDSLLTRRERDQGNLIIVGGPAVNPTATEFGGYFGISYRHKPQESFSITCERKNIYLDLALYPYEDICIVYIGQFDTRNVMLVWGYEWQGTYAGSMFMADPVTWEQYKDAYLLLLRWKDYNRDGLVQMAEITVEQFA